MHKRLVRLADGKAMSIKDYIETVVNYFYQTGLDPQDLNDSGHSKMLLTVSQRLDFLVGFAREQESRHIVPLKEMVSLLSEQLTSNGHAPPPDTRTEVNELIRELYSEGIVCPACGQPQRFRFADPVLVCQHAGCDYQLQIVFGNVVLEELDVLNLLTGGISRHFDGILLEGQEVAGRFFLDMGEGGRLKVVG